MQSFAQLLEQQMPRLRRYAHALTRDASRADDLVQDCLCRALQKQHLFTPDTNLRAWLFTLMHNQNANNVRCRMREGVQVPVEDVDGIPQLGASCTQGTTLQLRDLRRAIAGLPEEQRQVLLLVGLEGFAYDDAASILGVPIGTVRSRLSRARNTLRNMLGVEGLRSAA